MIKNKSPINRRVVVTGLGVVSSLGIGWEEFWKNLIAGKSGISRITSFDTSLYERHMGGEVKDFDASRFIHKRKIDKIGRTSQMAIAASKLALNDANLKLDACNKKMMAICLGTTAGEISLLEAFNDFKLEKSKGFDSSNISVFPAHALTTNVSIALGISGFNAVFASACASGNYAIGKGFDLIRKGDCDFALVGGADCFSRIVFTGFNRLYAIDPERCRPFDKDRKGMIPAEGAGILFLETLKSATKRDVPVYAEILGYGLSCDAYHMTIPSSKGVSKAITKALESSGITKQEIDYISAHGTGTSENDREECEAIKDVFGERSGKIPISSIKSMLGHTMGAASSLEAISCCLAIKYQKVPPTMNYKEKDPECDIDCVPNKAREHKIDIVLNNSQAFGGNNCCLVIKTWPMGGRKYYG